MLAIALRDAMHAMLAKTYSKPVSNARKDQLAGTTWAALPLKQATMINI
jgi:hypothetical protein